MTLTVLFKCYRSQICYHDVYDCTLRLDGCIVWNAHNTALGEEALLIYIVPVCYVKQVGMEDLVISLLVYTRKTNFSIITNIPLVIS